jgi:hypothetical protein
MSCLETEHFLMDGDMLVNITYLFVVSQRSMREADGSKGSLENVENTHEFR